MDVHDFPRTRQVQTQHRNTHQPPPHKEARISEIVLFHSFDSQTSMRVYHMLERTGLLYDKRMSVINACGPRTHRMLMKDRKSKITLIPTLIVLMNDGRVLKYVGVWAEQWVGVVTGIYQTGSGDPMAGGCGGGGSAVPADDDPSGTSYSQDATGRTPASILNPYLPRRDQPMVPGATAVVGGMEPGTEQPDQQQYVGDEEDPEYEEMENRPTTDPHGMGRRMIGASHSLGKPSQPESSGGGRGVDTASVRREQQGPSDAMLLAQAAMEQRNQEMETTHSMLSTGIPS